MAKRPGVTWHGLEALKAQVRSLPGQLLEEADEILRDAATAARADIVAAYPKGPTGNLKRGVKIFAARGSWIGGVDLKQTAPHGHLFEYGTKVRYTKDGAHRNRMFAKKGFSGPTFGPIAAHHQTLAMALLKSRLSALGADTVEGDSDVHQGRSASSRML